MTFRSNHYIVVFVLLLWSVKSSSLIHISHLHTVQGHHTSSLEWNILHLGSKWWTGWVDKKTLQTANTKTWLPMGSSACLSLINHSSCRWCLHDCCHTLTHKSTQSLPPSSPSHFILSLSSCSRFEEVCDFDLRVWGSAAIRLCDDQGHPGTCLLVWNDVACHGFKWQPHGSVSSTGSRHRHD